MSVNKNLLRFLQMIFVKFLVVYFFLLLLYSQIFSIAKTISKQSDENSNNARLFTHLRDLFISRQHFAARIKQYLQKKIIFFLDFHARNFKQ